MRAHTHVHPEIMINLQGPDVHLYVFNIPVFVRLDLILSGSITNQEPENTEQQVVGLATAIWAVSIMPLHVISYTYIPARHV